MIKCSVQKEDITNVDIYTPNIEAPQHIRQMLTAKKKKEEINNNTIIVGDFNTPLTSMDRSSKQKINKETQALNDTLDQMDIIDIYRAFHLKAAEYTLFTNAHETFSRTDDTLSHRIVLVNLRKLKSYQVSFLTMKL